MRKRDSGACPTRFTARLLQRIVRRHARRRAYTGPLRCGWFRPRKHQIVEGSVSPAGSEKRTAPFTPKGQSALWRVSRSGSKKPIADLCVAWTDLRALFSGRWRARPRAAFQGCGDHGGRSHSEHMVLSFGPGRSFVRRSSACGRRNCVSQRYWKPRTASADHCGNRRHRDLRQHGLLPYAGR